MKKNAGNGPDGLRVRRRTMVVSMARPWRCPARLHGRSRLLRPPSLRG